MEESSSEVVESGAAMSSVVVEEEVQEEPLDNYTIQMNIGKNILDEMKSELSALDPSFIHCIRLIEEEIKRRTTNNDDSTQPQKEKIFISYEDQKAYNLVGRLLGPKGLTLKRIQAETCTKMSILGKGSLKDSSKEEELRKSGNSMYTHLNEDLHVLIEAGPPASVHKIAAGAAEVRKMLIPPEPGQPDFASKYDMPGRMPPYGGPGFRGPPPPHYRGGYPPMMPPSRRGGRMRNVKGRPRDRPSNDGWNRGGGGGGGGSGDSWGGDSSVSKDYNHGVSGATSGYGYGTDAYSTTATDQSAYSTGVQQTTDTTGAYYSSFADTSASAGQSSVGAVGGTDAYGTSTDSWKSATTRTDYRYHPYDNGPTSSSTTGTIETTYY